MAAGYPVIFIGSGEDGPTIVATNVGGIRAAILNQTKPREAAGRTQPLSLYFCPLVRSPSRRF
jgi:hypothetical protein